MSVRDRLREGLARLPPRLRRQVLHGLGRYAPWEMGFDFTPPAPGPGDEVGPPSFVGIGAQKAGTTWWYELMSTHPSIFTRHDIHKERHFFDRFGARSMGPSDIDQYHRWFPRPIGSVTGEWTPDYLNFPWVPALLRRAAPETRLLLLLRDPVERFRSGLDHLDRMGAPRDGTAIADAVQRGFYFRALQVWLEEFAPDQLLVLQHERCVVDRDGQLDATFHHLGLPPHHPTASGQAARTPSGGHQWLDDDVRRYLTALYEPDVTALATAHPGLDLALWPNFAYLAGPADPASGPNSPTRRP
jgi:Sulfotransferase domain